MPPKGIPKGEINMEYGHGWGIPAPVKKDKNEKGTGYVNFCKQEIMSVCSAGNKWAGEHARCKYAIKASYSDRCMHFVLDGNCDSVKAQRNL